MFLWETGEGDIVQIYDNPCKGPNEKLENELINDFFELIYFILLFCNGGGWSRVGGGQSVTSWLSTDMPLENW